MVCVRQEHCPLARPCLSQDRPCPLHRSTSILLSFFVILSFNCTLPDGTHGSLRSHHLSKQSDLLLMHIYIYRPNIIYSHTSISHWSSFQQLLGHIDDHDTIVHYFEVLQIVKKGASRFRPLAPAAIPLAYLSRLASAQPDHDPRFISPGRSALHSSGR